eukprot:2839419-Prymnesium_polylepis.1
MSILSWPPEELKGRTVNLQRVFRKEAFDFALGPLTNTAHNQVVWNTWNKNLGRLEYVEYVFRL